MSDTITVRDHSQPCEHGSLWHHWFTATKRKWWQEPDCLGGKEMTLRGVGDGVWMEVDEDPDETADPE